MDANPASEASSSSSSLNLAALQRSLDNIPPQEQSEWLSGKIKGASLDWLPPEVCDYSPRALEYALSHALPKLLYDIQLESLSSSLPCVSRYLHAVFRSASTKHRQRYLLGVTKTTDDASEKLELALLYPLCTFDVFKMMHSHLVEEGRPDARSTFYFALPKRMFRCLTFNLDVQADLDYIKYLLSLGGDANSHKGFPLIWAMYAADIWLVDLLLRHGADPNLRHGQALAVGCKNRRYYTLKRLLAHWEGEVEIESELLHEWLAWAEDPVNGVLDYYFLLREYRSPGSTPKMWIA